MEKKKPITSKEAAAALAEFIAKNWHWCPISENVDVPDCECWKSGKCAKCIKKHAADLATGVMY